MKPALRQFVIDYVARHTNTFGGGKSAWGNPIAEALKDNPPCFAAGVDVGEVVTLVFAAIKEASLAATALEQDLAQFKSITMGI